MSDETKWTVHNIEELCELVLSPPMREQTMDEWRERGELRLWPRKLRANVEPGAVVRLRLSPEGGRMGFAVHALVDVLGRSDDGYRGRVLRVERGGPPEGTGIGFGPEHVMDVVFSKGRERTEDSALDE